MSSADALALQLGGSYVQLGVNMPATAIPSGSVSGGYPEEVVLYFGIIDILQVKSRSCGVSLCMTSVLAPGILNREPSHRCLNV